MTPKMYNTLMSRLDQIEERQTAVMRAALGTKDVLTEAEAIAYAGWGEEYGKKILKQNVLYSKPNGDLKSSGAKFIERKDLEAYLMSNPIPAKAQRV